MGIIKKARQEVENSGEQDLFAQEEKTKQKTEQKPEAEQISPQEVSNKHSIEGSDFDTSTDKVFDDKDLTPQQKLLKSFGEKLGAQVEFFRNKNGDFHGVHKSGQTFLNVNSNKPLGKVFWHETLHWMKNNNTKLYQQLVKAAGITDAQRKAYLKETERTDIRTPDEINEEILCDMMEDTAKRTGLLQSIAGKNRGLIERMIQWLKDTMNKFIEHFLNPSGKLTTKQAQALADEFGKIAKDLVDPNGDKIFRYNRRTHNIELADGRGLNDESQTKKALADLAKAAWNDKNFNGKVSFKPSKKFRDKAQEIFGHDVTEIFITGSDIRHIKKKHGTNENLRGQIDMTPEMIPDIYDVVNDFDIAEQGETDNLGQKAIEVTKNINGGQGYVITAERGTKKAEIKTALKRRNSQVPNAESPEQNVRNDPVTSSDENISQGEGKIKYSIGNSNSSESLTQKIRNKVSLWLDGKRPSERRGKRITDNLRKLSKHRILYGNVAGANDIVVDHMQQLIQSRRTYDWEKLLPVVGKEIAKNLKLNPTSELSNYIADWLLTGALNNTSPEATLFQKAMRDNPAMAETLQETRDLFQEFADMSASERIGSSIVNQQGKSFLERLGVITGDFTEQVLDDLSPLQKVVDKAIKDATPAVAEFIKRNVNPKQLAQLSRGKGSIAKQMVNGKTSEVEKIHLSLSEQYPGVRFNNFKPITAIIESVDGDWQGLQTFAVAKLSKEMYEYNRAHPELTEPLTPYTSEADADAVIKQGEKKFGEAQRDLVRFSKILLAMEHDSGLITDKTFYSLLKSWKHYVPMAQVFDENEDYTKLDHLKRRKGHLGDTWSPIQIMMANTHKRIQACERNKVKLELVTLVRFGNFDSNLSEVASSNPDADNIIRFRENGKIKYLETPDPAIKRAVESLQSKSDGAWITKALRAITSFMRMRLTGGNLDFAAGNMFRDLPDAYIHNDQLGKNVFVIGDLMRAWCSAVKELGLAALGKGQSQDLIDWKMSGGAQAAFVSEDVDYIQRSIDDATSTRLQRYKKKPFSQLLDDMQKFAEFTESVTRLTTYKLAKAKLDKSGAETLTSKQLAALAAREASVDFAKAGSSTRKANQVVLFLNAAIQSLNLWIEAGKKAAKGDTKPLFGKLFRAVAHGVFFAALQAAFANMGDDDDKEAYEQAQSWEKETYWIFPAIKNPITGKPLKIPKAFDFGMRLMANLTDEILADRPIELKRFRDTFIGALPSLTATLITPAIEAYSNYSIFREAPIVPLREQHLDAEAQYDANTSPVAKHFGKLTGWSPRKIDYLINGYLGFMGRFATNPSTDPDKFPMVRRFIFEPYKNPKIVKEYYEAYEEQTSHYNTYKLTKEKPDDYDPALYKRLKAANEPMRQISNKERAIMNDPNLSYSERRAKLTELEKKRVALCKKVFQQAR